jgi:hypothetical protein
VLVWDNDPDREDRFDDPYTFVLIHDEDKIVDALIHNGFKPTVVETLPDDLSLYDLIFVCIGWTTC